VALNLFLLESNSTLHSYCVPIYIKKEPIIILWAMAAIAMNGSTIPFMVFRATSHMSQEP